MSCFACLFQGNIKETSRKHHGNRQVEQDGGDVGTCRMERRRRRGGWWWTVVIEASTLWDMYSRVGDYMSAKVWTKVSGMWYLLDI